MERNPLVEESPLSQPLKWLTEQLLRAPGLTVGGRLHFLSEQELQGLVRQVSQVEMAMQSGVGFQPAQNRVQAPGVRGQGSDEDQFARLKELEPRYLTAEEGRMGFVLLRFKNVESEF